MSTANTNVAAVATDFILEKTQALNTSGVQVRDKAAFEQGTAPVSFSKEEIVEMTQALNEYTEELNTNLGFSIREGLNKQVVVEIKNTDTNETIKQFPPEELLEIKEKMAELVGMLFDVSV